MNKLSQFMHQPTVTHQPVVKRVLQYLKGTITHSLLHQQSPLHLHAFVNANKAGDPKDHTSACVNVIFLGVNLISQSSKKQRTVVRFSTKAYRAIVFTTIEIIWLMNLFSELRLSLSSTPTIYCDNINATYLYTNLVFHSSMKHVAIDFYLICDQVSKNLLQVSYLHTNDQLFYSFTKALPRKQFYRHRSKPLLVMNMIRGR